MINSKVQRYPKENINYSPFNTCLLNTGHIDTRHKDLSRLHIKGKIRYLYIYNYFLYYDIISEFKHWHINVLLTTGSILLYLKPLFHVFLVLKYSTYEMVNIMLSSLFTSPYDGDYHCKV